MQELHIDSHKSNGRWTHEEHLLFLEGLRIYGKNWKKIEQLLQTRTGSQIRSHAQKFFLKMNSNSQTAQKEQSQGCQPQEEQEDATVNSKQTVDSPSQSEDSYFLSKIIEFSNSRQCLDFWQGLVDCKHERISKCSRADGNASFSAYGRGNQIQREGCSGDKILA